MYGVDLALFCTVPNFLLKDQLLVSILKSILIEIISKQKLLVFT